MANASDVVFYVCASSVDFMLQDIEGILDNDNLTDRRKCYEIFRECFHFGSIVWRTYKDWKKKYRDEGI